jgi:TonB family protein
LVVPSFKSLRSGRILGDLDRDSSADAFSTGSGRQSESAVLASLKELVATGDQRLEPILKTITDNARQLTGASGAALAMWKEGAMVCRGRSGDTAPPIGAKLSAETGISGECLRTGKVQNCSDTENDPLVDLEVCRSLGLRSIAVLPILGWRGINGVIEVFSTQTAAFTEKHIDLLQQLAALAERARASQPHGASAAAPKTASGGEKAQPSGLLPASDRVGDVALAFVDNRSRPFVLGGIAVGAIALLALVVWLGWRGPGDMDGKAHAAAPTSTAIQASGGRSAVPNAATAESFTAHPPDNDPIWKPNPGGEVLFPPTGKPSAGSPVTFASKVDPIPAAVSNKKTAARAPLLSDLADRMVIPRGVTAAQRGSGERTSAETAPSEPPSITSAASGADLNGVLAAKASLPSLNLPVSQGVSGGQLVRRIPPVYPEQARLSRVEGTVVVSAVVMEDGTVGELKVIEGPAALAQPALDAVKHWRYQPYRLDGKAVKNEIKVKIDFKLPKP